MLVHRGNSVVRGKLLPWGINQARDLDLLMLIGEAYVIELWELRPEGRTACVNCPDPFS